MPRPATSPLLFLALAPIVLLSACGGRPTPGVPAAAPSPSASRSAQEGVEQDAERQARLAELERLYNARLAQARAKVHESDVAFVNGMISHHAQALVMSRLAPSNGASPAIQTLTGRIINAQSDEIANMQGWLRDRDLPVPQVNPDGTMPMDHAGGHHHLMPGMLSDAQLAELSAARGDAYDRLFLTYMIQHHQGAVGMVHDLFATDGAAQDDFIFKIASDIQVDQITEIDRMRLMLDALTPGS